MTKIFVTFTMPGFHYWPSAPERRRYLTHLHRHLFHVRIETAVQHLDREIEFHDLIDAGRRFLKDLADPKGNFESLSCEAMAQEVASRLAQLYSRDVTVTVSEDGECGATVLAT